MKSRHCYTVWAVLALQWFAVSGASPGYTAVATGSNVTLRCVSSRAICQDRYEHGWFRYEDHSFLVLSRCLQVLPTGAVGSRTSVSIEGNAYLLTIADSQPEDSGNYVCFNAWTWRFSDALVLEVMRRPSSVDPSLAVSPGDKTVGLSSPSLHPLSPSTITPSAGHRDNQTLTGTTVNSDVASELGLDLDCNGGTARENQTRVTSERGDDSSETGELPIVWVVSCAMLLLTNAITALFAVCYRRKANRLPTNLVTALEMKTWRPRKSEGCVVEAMPAKDVEIPPEPLYAELDL